MICKNTRSESGIALPLAIIMVLLVSVVGAGLLTFVVSDLQAADETRRGQQAFGLADAGIAAAQNKLRSFPQSNLTSGTCPSGASEWCDPDGMKVSLDGATGAAQVKITPPGTTLGEFTVSSIGTSGSGSTRRVVAKFRVGNAANGAITGPGAEVFPQTIYAHKTSTFDRLALNGSTPNANGSTTGLRMFSGKTVDIRQTDFILKDASLYSGGDIKLPEPGSLATACASAQPLLGLTIKLLPNSPGIASSGADPDGNWSNGFNSTARKVMSPGMGAAGSIGYRDRMICKPFGWGSRFFDKDTRSSLLGSVLEGVLGSLLGSNRLDARFVATPSSPQMNREVTYPFDENLLTATNPTTGKTGLRTLADGLITASRGQTKSYTASQGASDIASSQGNYIEVRNGKSTVTVCDASNPACGSGLNIVWPTVPASTPPERWPVVYIKFGDSGSSNAVSWKVQSSPQFSGSDPASRCAYARTNTPNSVRRGILVVENGRIDLSESAAPLDGGMITIGEPNSHNRDIGGSAGDLCIRGSILADGQLSRQNYTEFGALPYETYRLLPGLNAPPVTSSQINREEWREAFE